MNIHTRLRLQSWIFKRLPFPVALWIVKRMAPTIRE